MTTTFEVRLTGAPEAPGEIRLGSLARLAGALQELTVRAGRQVADRGGRGRTPELLKMLTTLTLVSVHDGSTVLSLRRGDDTDLGMDLSLEREIDDTVFGVIEAIRSGERPAWMGDALAESAGDFAKAMRLASPLVTFTFPGPRRSELHTEALDDRAWNRAFPERSNLMVVVGRLAAVDLETGRFHIRDDAGNRLPLNDTAEADEVATLIGQRVRARGVAVRDARGAVTRLDEVHIEAAPRPAAWHLSEAADVADLAAAAPGPDPDGGVELTDEEYSIFLRAIHE